MDAEQELLLVKKAQAGDRAALGMVYDDLTPKLFGYLVNTLKNKTVAEDLLQSTWLKAISALPKYRSRGIRFQSWLFAIAHNECRQYWRKGKRESDMDVSEFEVPDAHQDQSDNNLLVEQVLSKLSADDRELLRLRYIADLPVNDIARILNINFVAVRARLHRALARARQNIN